jgi:hypothetical protein
MVKIQLIILELKPSYVRHDLFIAPSGMEPHTINIYIFGQQTRRQKILVSKVTGITWM